MSEPNESSGVGWVSMLVFAAGFVGLGVWGIASGRVPWGIGSVLFGLAWGVAALRARHKAKSED